MQSRSTCTETDGFLQKSVITDKPGALQLRVFVTTEMNCESLVRYSEEAECDVFSELRQKLAELKDLLRALHAGPADTG